MKKLRIYLDTSVFGGCFDREFEVESNNLSEEIESLRDAYMKAGVLGSSCLRDAEHIATASVVNCDLVVSWNFKHIVHFDKIAGFNAVNIRLGYKALSIFSPKEVVEA